MPLIVSDLVNLKYYISRLEKLLRKISLRSLPDVNFFAIECLRDLISLLEREYDNNTGTNASCSEATTYSQMSLNLPGTMRSSLAHGQIISHQSSQACVMT